MKTFKSVPVGNGKVTIFQEGYLSLLDDDSPYGKVSRVPLEPQEAANLASSLLQWATQNRGA